MLWSIFEVPVYNIGRISNLFDRKYLQTGFAYSASFAASPDRSLNNLLDVPTRLSILAFQGSISDMPRESRLKWTQILLWSKAYDMMYILWFIDDMLL